MGRLLALGLTLGALGALGCSSNDKPPPLGDLDGSVVVVPPSDAASNGPCDPPKAGCPCSKPGEQVYCGIIYRASAGRVDCSKGYVTCQEDGGFGPCEGASIYMGD